MYFCNSMILRSQLSCLVFCVHTYMLFADVLMPHKRRPCIFLVHFEEEATLIFRPLPTPPHPHPLQIVYFNKALERSQEAFETFFLNGPKYKILSSLNHPKGILPKCRSRRVRLSKTPSESNMVKPLAKVDKLL